jgi:two-component system, OmpR family, sensor histidine kinase KdpD
MRARVSRLFLRPEPPSLAAGLVVAVLAVAAITVLIFALREVSPAESTGVAYLLAVLLVSSLWGLRLGLVTSVLSAAAFNYFHLPPTGRFTIADSRHWVALGVFLVAAVVASSVAELARSRAVEAEQRRREADLAAELARVLLGGASVRETLDDAAARLAEALSLERAEIVLEPAVPGDADRLGYELRSGGRRLGTLFVDGRVSAAVRARLRERVVPALEALLAAALERDRLQSEVVETRVLRRSDELKTALLQTVSHDLRTPLTAIMAAGSALAAGELSRADREELGRAIVEESERLTALVEKVLDLSRLQAGAAAPRREWVSVEEILRETAAQLDPSGERFAFSLDRDLPLIRADGVQLERAFANLLENAARYSGAARVHVRARVVGPQLKIRIVDRGPGISPEELRRIFEAFYRVASQRDGHTGSGLGLAIVKGFVEANGGQVWAESLPGQGTSFVVAFPVEPSAPTTSAEDGVQTP